MKKSFVMTAGVFGFIGVALGAFGGHALKELISPEMLEIYKIGVQYHLIHAVVLLVIALSGKEFIKQSFVFFAAGILLFSFSLYAYAISGLKFLVFITPLGGTSLLIGWGLVVYQSWKQVKE
ncbi:MAG: DUF423 domain-containing protein [Ignavibacteriaceae bacterium]|jgi:uncharacterized membrane protein YgdD (TMEM256/DUF423 family)